MSLNKVAVQGRFSAKPELKTTNSGKSVCSFGFAVDSNFKSQNGDKETYWLDVVAWGKTAEFVVKYFDRGSMAIVDGRLQTRSYEDKNGNKRKAVEIVAENIYFGGSKRDSADAPTHTDPDNAAPGQFEELPNSGELPF